MDTLLFVGRWNAITRDQENVLRRLVRDYSPARVFFVVTGSDQSNTKRTPLTSAERVDLLKAVAPKLCRQFEIFAVTDVPDSSGWVKHVEESVVSGSQGRQRIDPGTTILISGNPDVLRSFEEAAYTAIRQDFSGAAPSDLIGALVSGRSWRALANEATVQLYESRGIEDRIRKIFSDVALTDDGELTPSREFVVYVRGMEAGTAQKVLDIAPHVRPGRIVDKGCGSGLFLLELSKLFPTSQLLGLELSRELLRVADGRHYPASNVAIVQGNAIQPHFPPGTVDTVIFSSVMHEIYSYSRYDRDVVRLALANTRGEMKRGGALIIRDGVRPPSRRVWMRCDGTTEARFRSFAKEFKDQGVKFQEREHLKRLYFILDLHDANEFLTKKDYTENWAAEVREEFGIWTLEEWKKELESASYRVVQARSYVNPWIAENRYKNKAWLYADGVTVPGEELPFPDTTLVLVGEA